MNMDIDENVMKFIKCSRYSTYADELSESEQTRLKALFDDCLSAIIKEYVEEFMPSFIICDTYNKYSTVLPVRLYQNKYKYYILYDCHLNQINRFLDALYLDNNDSAHDVWKLSYELFAENALLEENEILVSYYGLNKVALGPFEVNVEEQVDLDFIIDIQERYIIGHELGHWIYKVSENKNVESIFNISLDAEWFQFLENIKMLLCELYEEYGKKFQSEEYVELIHEQRHLVNENNGILEECFADAVAYAMTFSYVALNYSDDLNRKLLAGLYFEGNERLFDNMLEETVVRYEERITNIMLECFSELEDRGDNIYHSCITY